MAQEDELARTDMALYNTQVAAPRSRPHSECRVVFGTMRFTVHCYWDPTRRLDALKHL